MKKTPVERTPLTAAYKRYISRQIDAYQMSLSRTELMQLGEQAAAELSAASEGAPALTEALMLHAVDRVIMKRLALQSYRQWRRQHGLTAQSRPAILGPDGQPATARQTRIIVVEASGISEDLLLALRRDPKLLYSLSPRKFEELVADLLQRQGFTCELTPAQRDGGKDIVARLSTRVGSFVFYVECKRYSAHQVVGVRLVRELLGVIDHDRVTAGLLVTTSTFSAGAYNLRQKEPHRLSLRDYGHLVSWLEESRSGRPDERR